MATTITPALQTPDGAWRVEVATRGRSSWYRLLHSDDLIDWLSIASVERILAEAGVHLADLVPAGTPTDQEQPGAA
jgi:hypothetical protein